MVCSSAHSSQKFSNACQSQLTVRLTSISLASLLLLASVASATEAGPGSTSSQTNTRSSSASQGESDARDLELGKPIERELAGGQRHTYRVSLRSGQFLHAVVEPRVIGLTATLFGPDGKPLIRLALAAGSSQPLFLVAKEQGIYRIEIRSPEGAAASSYRLKVEELRLATPQDTNRALAQSALAEGQQLHKEGAAAPKQKAIESYEQALPFWRAAGDRQGEAETLYELGSAHQELGKNQQDYSLQ
jgi:hypothetical protein